MDKLLCIVKVANKHSIVHGEVSGGSDLAEANRCGAVNTLTASSVKLITINSM